MYILLIFYLNYSIASIPFSTQKDCEAAAIWAKEQSYRMRASYFYTGSSVK